MIGPLTGAANVPPLLAPVTLLCTTVQKYWVPATAFGLLNAILVAVPLQITCEAGATEISGVGSTNALTSKVAPLQPAPLRGVILYVTVCCTLLGFTNV